MQVQYSAGLQLSLRFSSPGTSMRTRTLPLLSLAYLIDAIEVKSPYTQGAADGSATIE
jgi:hypothetical protein